MTQEQRHDWLRVSVLIAVAIAAGILANVLAIARSAHGAPAQSFHGAYRAGATCTVTDRNPCSSVSGPFGSPPARRTALREYARIRPAVRSPRVSPPAGIYSIVTAAAQAEGVPVAIAHAVIRHESGYRPHLRGRAGEWGLGQIKCQTARGLGWVGDCAMLANPSVNAQLSMRYLRRALDRGGSGCAGVSLYQRGIGARPLCTAYGRLVMAGAR